MYDQIASLAGDAEQLFEAIARRLAAERKFHELFDARLAQSRHRLGLPLDQSGDLDDLPEPVRSELEAAYLQACREAGQLLLDAGRFREAWMYLRPAGEKNLVRESLERVVPKDDRMEELIQVALHEGVAVQRGLGWMLGHYGTCNSITTFEGLAPRLEIADQQACAAVLVRHLHNELLRNVRAHVEQREGAPPATNRLAELITGRDWLFENDNYHTDTSHLAAVVRFARLLEEPAAVELALDLVEYGRRLAPQLQYPGDPPFEDLYASHRLLFLATLGRQVDEAIDFFRQQAETLPLEEHGTAAIETCLVLLVRVGRPLEALETYAALVPTDVSLSPYAPSLLELARRSRDWDTYLRIMRDRDDVVGYAIGQLESQPATAATRT